MVFNTSQKQKNTIGRTKASTFCIKDSSVSERHGEIRYENEKWVILDTDSSNGTQVNGVLCDPRAPYELTDGDVIKLGESTVCHIEVVTLPDKTTSVEGYLTKECERMISQVQKRADTLTSNMRHEIDSALQEITSTT